MSTAHKLQDEWLLSYAAGALNPGRSLMVASHLAYHDDMQNTVADAEVIGGALLNAMDEAEAAGSPRLAIKNDLHFGHLAKRTECFPYVFFGGVVRQISNIDVHRTKAPILHSNHEPGPTRVPPVRT